MSQVLLIDEVGCAETIMSKGGVDLRELGEVSVQRVSLIEFDQAKQKFWVKFLSRSLPECLMDEDGNCRFFDDYDDARDAEVIHLSGNLIRGLRVAG